MSRLRGFIVSGILAVLCCSENAWTQVQPPMPGVPGAPGGTRDTSSNKTNTTEWKNEDAKVYFTNLQSQKKLSPDSSIHTFHRRPFVQPWHRDLGNLGTAVRNLVFTPEFRVGPTFGYRVFDVYRYDADSVQYYNTTRPYSVFAYQLGSKLEQVARLLHTQNITPGWNVAGQYQKITSQGYYRGQRTNHDNAALTTNYKSKRQHYQLNGAVTYNKEQHDENGGIIDEGLLDSSDFFDRSVIPTVIDNRGYSERRSPVSNMLRDYTILLQHSYTAGKEDTLYNEDSTKYTYRLTPRFRLTHRLELRSEKHIYKDLRPDSLRYTGLFENGFQEQDSVYSLQKWFKVDNRVLLNGYFGKPGKQLAFTAGLGNRIDNFRTIYLADSERTNMVNNYVIGEIKKEALEAGQWGYQASTQFYFTGVNAGDLLLNLSILKEFRDSVSYVSAGLQQQLQSSPYNYTIYANQYSRYTWSFNKESITQVYANFQSDKLNLAAGIRNYVVANYIYMNTQQRPDQYAGTFNVTQVFGRKLFNLGHFVFDNEIVLQQKTGGAPVNIPLLLGRHQFAFESYMFKRALKVATGFEVRYHSPYASAGYAPFFNRFYYQNTYILSNTPEMTIFFNFKIKQFRASLSVDQFQQLFSTNIITTPSYPAQNLMIRFGFSWTLVN